MSLYSLFRVRIARIGGATKRTFRTTETAANRLGSTSVHKIEFALRLRRKRSFKMEIFCRN
ncbi:hypothetical protein D8780_04995 [Notoacmeibacter ruber]|uniref:Uncharacterized protein n=1 Tax=Notoacmeibacter ruber TaxID=2670375 RepID=A0A3L7JA84_9HYPH|nr:hypothetical protein D8780_04995 [Notoacmeibacter ruber]